MAMHHSLPCVGPTVHAYVEPGHRRAGFLDNISLRFKMGLDVSPFILIQVKIRLRVPFGYNQRMQGSDGEAISDDNTGFAFSQYSLSWHSAKWTLTFFHFVFLLEQNGRAA